MPDKYAQTQAALGQLSLQLALRNLTKALGELSELEAERVAGKNPKEGKQRVSETPSWLIMTVSVSGCFKKGVSFDWKGYH